MGWFMVFEAWEGMSPGSALTICIADFVARPWIWPIRLWDPSISGGKVAVGNGTSHLKALRLNTDFDRDVAAGFAILEEAGGLVTTANPPSDPETADITRAHLGGRLYLAIR